LLVLLALATARPTTARADPPQEPLDHFPAADLSVESHGRSHPFHVWLATTEPRR
jgi:hypothetical protein